MKLDDGMSLMARQFGLDKLFVERPRIGEVSAREAVDPSNVNPFAPEWADLVRLFALARMRRVTTILEFGCGFSTSIFAHALELNESELADRVSAGLRRTDAFQLFVVDDMVEFAELTQSRLSEKHRKRTSFHLAEVRMTTFGDRICTEYASLPNMCPDFIYLDGPSQDSATGDISGISTRHPDRLPMACDILKIEHFLLPGTLILVDGRTANARFLKANLQREWRYEHDVDGDVHYFEMIEEPLGKWNRRQIELCLGADWRAKPLRPDYTQLTSLIAR